MAVEAITRDDARYAMDLVTAICTEVGPGLPGSPQERERAAMIQVELESHLGAGNVAVEEFSLSPEAFVGSLPVSGLLLLLAALLNGATGRWAGSWAWAAATAALVLALLSPLPFFQYVRYGERLDFLFTKKVSQNVIGTLRKPGAGPVKRLLILSGHHDSAWENTWIGFLGYGLYVTVPTVFLGCLTMVVMSILQWAGVASGQAGLARAGTLGGLLWAYPILPAVVFALFFTRGRKG